jgi:hypothetical protein
MGAIIESPIIDRIDHLNGWRIYDVFDDYESNGHAILYVNTNSEKIEEYVLVFRTDL